MTDLPPYTRGPLTTADGMPVIGWWPMPQPAELPVEVVPADDQPVDVVPARCRCGHARINHTAGEGQCWSTACGCSTYRDRDVPTPSELGLSYVMDGAGTVHVADETHMGHYVSGCLLVGPLMPSDPVADWLLCQECLADLNAMRGQR